MAGPLEGIRILDWTQWQMGTVATCMLADLGADVIHIEDRIKGDPGRAWDRNLSDLPGGRRSYFECNNRGKRGIIVDLTQPKGKEMIYRLVKNSDVFAHNFRQGVPEKLGLDYENLRCFNDKLIYAAASGYGPEGPEAAEGSFDFIGQARSGIMTMIGEPDTPPLPVHGGIADQMGAIMTAYGIMTALFARERFGIGQKLDVSHLASMVALQGLTVGKQLYLNQEWQKRFRTKAPNPLFNYYECKGQKWLMLAMPQSDRQWPDVCRALGLEHLEKDPRFGNVEKRGDNCEALVDILAQVLITKTTAQWTEILRESGDIFCTTVQTIPDLLEDPQMLANNYIIDSVHDTLGPIKVVGPPVKFSKTPGEIRSTAPEFGQHTEEVLIEVGGYSWEEITDLKKEEVI